MIGFKKVCEQLNPVGQCRKYGLPIWQCPQFLFLVMGALIILSSLLTYSIGNKYIEDPQVVALATIVLSAVLLVIASIITQSFDRLAEISRMKTEFINIVSHQLRAPLSNLKWALDYLMSGKIDASHEKQLEYFKILQENNTRMEGLISDLLTVSRIEQGNFFLKRMEINMKDMVSKIIKDAEIFSSASGLAINFQAEENMPNIIADSFQLKLVIENLLNNAIRYTKKDGKIDIKLFRRNENIYFEIDDSGIGIPKTDQKYIFQKFFRASNILRHDTQGSGLGLYIVKSIIIKSKGKIGFKSQEGVGSTFWFTLPIKR